MKTKDLIKALQEADPSGECHVEGYNGPVYYVERMQGYWDGPGQQLIQDESKKPYYSIVGGKLDYVNDKVVLYEMNLKDTFVDHHSNGWPFELVVERSDIERAQEEQQKTLERWTEEAIKWKTEYDTWVATECSECKYLANIDTLEPRHKDGCSKAK